MHARWLAMFPAAAALLAQTAPQPASLSGTVTSSVTGEPIVRAHVTAQCMSEEHHDGSQNYGALTNSKGEFSLSPLPSGNCSIEVQRVGFVPSRSRETYVLSSGAHHDGIKLTLVPTGAITGRVLNSAGEPAQGINVSAEMTNGNSSAATTDDKGQFRMGGLHPGKYRVKASKESMPLPPEIRADGSTEMREAATYFPESLSAKTAQRVDVKAGAEVSGIEIKLVQTPIVQVSGTVTGLPPGAKNVMVNVQHDTSGQGAGVKADGTFSLWRLDPGKYTLQAHQWSGPTQLQSAPLEIEVTTANLDRLELRMVPPFEIAGQLRFDDEQAREPIRPPAKRDGTAPPAPPPDSRTVQLRPLDPQGFSGNAIVSGEDGFLLESVPPARYRVTVTGVSGYVKSLRAGNTETDGDMLDVRNGSPGPVTITLSSNYCEISGTVSDAKGPVADARVVLVSVDEPSTARTTQSDSGTYKFRVPPGKYNLAALDDAVSWGFQGPDLEDYEPESLDLTAGDKITKDLVRRK